MKNMRWHWVWGVMSKVSQTHVEWMSQVAMRVSKTNCKVSVITYFDGLKKEIRKEK
jgi:hypothetical protein